MITQTWTRPCPDCGRDRIFKTRKGYTDSVKYNSSCNACKKPNTYIDITGGSFGKWSVLRRASVVKDGHVGWLCQCICGNERVIASNNLKRGLTKSCGCEAKKRPFEWLFLKMMRSSTREKRKCDLTYEQFLEFTQIVQCSYCRFPIKWTCHSSKGEPSGYYLDRKDNNIGYTKDNCIVCCGDCNHIKGARFTYTEMCRLGEIVGNIKRERKMHDYSE